MMAGLTTRNYGEGTMDPRNDQTAADHQGLVDRINAAAERAQAELDRADRTSADGGTQDLTGLRAAVSDMMAAAHGFEALMKAGAAPPREGSAGARGSGQAGQASSSPGQSAPSGSPAAPGSSSPPAKS